MFLYYQKTHFAIWNKLRLLSASTMTLVQTRVTLKSYTYGPCCKKKTRPSDKYNQHRLISACYATHTGLNQDSGQAVWMSGIWMLAQHKWPKACFLMMWPICFYWKITKIISKLFPLSLLSHAMNQDKRTKVFVRLFEHTCWRSL